MTIIEDSGGLARRPNGARVVGGRLAITLQGLEGANEEIIINREIVHEKIHEGEFFSAGVFNSALGAGATLNVLIQTGTLPMHVRFASSASQAIQVLLFEGTTFSAAGTAVPAVSRNRVHSVAVGATITQGPTITLDGAQLFGGFIAGGTSGQAQGGEISAFNEYIFNPSTVYCARLVNNLAAGVTIAQMSLEFYEALTGYE